MEILHNTLVQSFKMKLSGVMILQGVKCFIFLLIFAWALQQCSANVLPVTKHTSLSLNMFGCSLKTYLFRQ